MQHQVAQRAGVPNDQVVLCDQKADAIDALLTGKIDVYASAALGNRILAARIGGELASAVSHATANIDRCSTTKSALSFKKGSRELMDLFKGQLRRSWLSRSLALHVAVWPDRKRNRSGSARLNPATNDRSTEASRSSTIRSPQPRKLVAPIFGVTQLQHFVPNNKALR